MDLGDAIFLNLLLGVGMGLLLWAVPARCASARSGACLVLAGMTAYYLWWRVASLPSFAFSIWSVWPWVFFHAEVIAITYEMWCCMVMVRQSNHTPDADRNEARLRDCGQLPTVDVLIVTHSEPIEVVEHTIAAARDLDYPTMRLRIYLCDDGDRPAFAALAAARGIEYIARPTIENEFQNIVKEGGAGKGGNLRYAFQHSNGAYILMLDADAQVHSTFLFRTLGFLLYRSDVGLVQTPQCFCTRDVIARNLLAGRYMPDEQHFFMTVVQASRDAWDNAFCVGTNCVVSRRALRQLDPGGFPNETICEDLELSYALRTIGYRTVFLNERIAFLRSAESVPDYIKQRVKWCAGTIQQLFIRTGPLRGRHRLLDRLFYLDGVLYWLGYLFVAMLLAAPPVYWFTGVPALYGKPEDVLAVLLPRLVVRAFVMHWMSQGRIPPFAVNVCKALPALHITVTMVRTLLSPFSVVFRVTEKGQSRHHVVVRWHLFLLFLGIAATTMLGMILNLIGEYLIVPINELTPLNIVWTVLSTLVCVLCALACVEPPWTGRPGRLSPADEVMRSDTTGILFALVRRLIGLS
jgi:cellulose synthase (UDP-forming)